MKGSRILVVEDSPTQGQMAVADLEAEGALVTLAGSGEAALDCLEARDFDLVLSDVVMPGIDGYELCKRIRERHAELPVVLLTSLTDPLDVVRGLQAGADNFLRKPYDRANLASRLRTILYNRAQRRSGRAAMGLELHFLGGRFMITSEREQILDLLVSTFEDLVAGNKELRDREVELASAHQDLRDQFGATEIERRRLGSVLAAVPETLIMVDAHGIISDISESASRLLCAPVSELLGRPADEVRQLVTSHGEALAPSLLPLHRALHAGEASEGGFTFDLLLERSDGSRLPVIERAAPVRDATGEVMGAVAVLTEISGLLARDPVTKLGTQALLLDRLERASALDHGTVALLAVVIDRFSLLRDALHPEQVDDALCAAAAVLTDLFDGDASAEHGDSSVSFLGHDTFAVLLTELDDGVSAVRAAHRLLDVLPIRVEVEGVTLELTTSVGVGLVTGPGTGMEAIAAAAATARRASADGGHAVAVFEPSVDVLASEMLRRETELRSAIEGGELRVHFQPLVHVGSAQVKGFEALVRWEHPERGLLAPGDFIPTAEASGLVVPLGWWVLREACQQMRNLHMDEPEASHLALSVNFAAQQLAEPDATARVRSILRQTGIAASSLVIEMTETSVNADPGATADRLRQLKALGVRVAIDDFGTGYSSLLQLHAFPVDELKIDQVFIASMGRDPGAATIVASTIGLGRNLGLDVVAEGVETRDQLDQLRSMGCDLAQGYYWSPALPADRLRDWLANHASGPGLAPIEDFVIGASAKERPRDEVLRSIAHEFNNSLGVIRGFAELIEAADGQDPATVEDASRIVRAVTQLKGTLDLLTDSAAMESGQFQLKRELLDLGALVRDVVAQHLSGASDNVHVSDSVTVLVMADRAGCMQIMRNLVSNAMKFSEPGSPIEILVVQNDDVATVSVRDHGVGVPEARRPELFRRFSRLGAGRPGVGLGLYLSRLIARAHGGDVRYEPPAGEGSLFVLELPRGALPEG